MDVVPEPSDGDMTSEVQLAVTFSPDNWVSNTEGGKNFWSLFNQ